MPAAVQKASLTKNFVQFCTKSLNPPQDYTKVEQASDSNYEAKLLRNRVKNFYNTARRHIKVGELVGAGAAILGVGAMYLGKKIENSFLDPLLKAYSPMSVIAGIIIFFTGMFGKNEYEKGIKNIVDDFVTRYSVNEDGTTTNINGGNGPYVRSLDDEMILSVDNEDLLNRALDLAEDKGVVINARGISHCGKSETGKAIARGCVKRGYCKHAQWWESKNEAIAKDLFADVIGQTFDLGWIRLGGETVTERIERLIANAVAHYRKTGEYVVISLEEAHELLGLETGLDDFVTRSRAKDFNPSDPLQRSAISNALGTLITGKIKQSMCKGVILVLTSNSNGENMAEHLRNRMVDLPFEKPDAKMRADLIKVFLEGAFKKKKMKPPVFTDAEYRKLGEIGSVNLLKDAFGGDRKQAIRAGLGDCIQQLHSYNILHGAHIETVINSAVGHYASTEKKALYDSIKRGLEATVSREVRSNRKGWVWEIKTYYGTRDKSSREPDFMELYDDMREKRRHRSEANPKP